MNDLRYEILKKIRDKNTRSIAIVMHNKPDGDAIGSAIALEKALKNYGKKIVDLIIHDKIHERFAPVVGSNRVNKIILPPEGRRYDLLIMVDFSDPTRTISNIKKRAKFIIVIDHHVHSKPFGNIYLCEKAAATGILIYKIIKSLTPISPEIATALYLAIRSDTGSYKNSNTDSKAHQITSELLIYGASIETVNSIYESRSFSFIKLMGSTLLNVKLDKKYKIAYLIVTRYDIELSGSPEDEISMLIDQIRGIKDCDMAFLFIEGIHNVRISARSKNRPVNKILEHFGGGGHAKAAGCAIEGEFVNDIAYKVIEYAKECIDENIC
jgi:Exopolyphosphatase-related proteins